MQLVILDKAAAEAATADILTQVGGWEGTAAWMALARIWLDWKACGSLLQFAVLTQLSSKLPRTLPHPAVFSLQVLPLFSLQHWIASGHHPCSPIPIKLLHLPCVSLQHCIAHDRSEDLRAEAAADAGGGNGGEQPAAAKKEEEDEAAGMEVEEVAAKVGGGSGRSGGRPAR